MRPCCVCGQEASFAPELSSPLAVSAARSSATRIPRAAPRAHSTAQIRARGTFAPGTRSGLFLGPNFAVESRGGSGAS